MYKYTTQTPGFPHPTSALQRDASQKQTGAANGTGEADSTCTSDSLGAVDHLSTGPHAQDGGVLYALLSPPSRLFAAHPKLLIFLGLNFAISGVPLIVFSVFAFSVALSALTLGVTIGLLGAGTIIVVSLGFAVTILIPTICITTCIACSLAFWILAALYASQWFFGRSDRDPKTSDDPVDAVDNSDPLRSGQWSTEFRQIVSARKETQ